tara:strand:+ start:436 stop:654 length:219 start_codon:yes stop_codon:yes gene_type:complete
MSGIAIWETALEESNPGDNKSRINKKITALLYVNLAEAYMWMDDFDIAESRTCWGFKVQVSFKETRNTDDNC